MENNEPKKGLTLVEILVVVLIAAVLSAIAYPLYTKSVTRARAVEAVNLLEIVRNKQLSNYSRAGAYYDDFNNMGQLTNNKAKETSSGATVTLDNYTLALNNQERCATVTYEKRGTKFSFSSNYETSGLGCEGDVCKSFGNVVGSVKDVCNCGDKTCPDGAILNPDTCECGTCSPGETMSCGKCGVKRCDASGNWGDCSGESGYCTPGDYVTCEGGGAALCPASCQNPCSSIEPEGCTSIADEHHPCGNCGYRECINGVWSACKGEGECTSGETRACNPGKGSSGTQICGNNCEWGKCCPAGTTWNGITCDGGTKECLSKAPHNTEACGKCGVRSRSITCNTTTGLWETGNWGACTGEGYCTPGQVFMCSGSGVPRVCPDTCENPCPTGESCGAAGGTRACGECGYQDCYGGAWTECFGDSSKTETCGKCGTKQCDTNGNWGACTGESGYCTPGTLYVCGSGGTAICPDTCQDPCPGSDCESGTSRACGNCGYQDCYGGVWTECFGEGECAPGDIQVLPDGQIKICSDTCTWPSCQLSPANCLADGGKYLDVATCSCKECLGHPSTNGINCPGCKTTLPDHIFAPSHIDISINGIARTVSAQCVVNFMLHSGCKPMNNALYCGVDLEIGKHCYLNDPCQRPPDSGELPPVLD